MTEPVLGRMRYSGRRLLGLAGLAVVLRLFLAYFSHQPSTMALLRKQFPWSYQCVENRCVKVNIPNNVQTMTLNTCKLTCDPSGVLWPRPSQATLATEVVQFLLREVTKTTNCQPDVCSLLDSAFTIFQNNLNQYHPDYGAGGDPWRGPWNTDTLTHKLVVDISVSEAETYITLGTDESYTLSVSTKWSLTTATITARTYFGARHALETLSQLVEYQEDDDALIMLRSAVIQDAPAFKYRGILVDTSRNFYSVASLERTLDTMAANKLNVFHWHLTDTHAFPLHLPSMPQLAHYGSYSLRHVYYPDDVRYLVEYARVRGIRVVPEFDAPAHVGNGWQFGEMEGLGRLAVCLNKEPWQIYCFEAPCGQLNIANPSIYDVLGHVYTDILQMFTPVELFHFGGDEVSLHCWNTSTEIYSWMKKNQYGVEEAAYYRQWGVFQDRARRLLRTANDGREIPGIIWTSHLTKGENLELYLNRDKYIIQIWSRKDDPVIKQLLTKNYKVIFSNIDAWYLDLGAGGWLNKCGEQCNRYLPWQTVYDNSPHDIAINHTGANQAHLILGGEAALWSEQADELNMDAKLWPRGSALAERLWTNPSTDWRLALTRMVHHRQRLVSRGVRAERLQPQWCHQNEGHCKRFDNPGTL